jgi:hypothetical protein
MPLLWVNPSIGQPRGAMGGLNHSVVFGVGPVPPGIQWQALLAQLAFPQTTAAGELTLAVLMAITHLLRPCALVSVIATQTTRRGATSFIWRAHAPLSPS